MQPDPFFDAAGKMAIGSRLRRLTDTVTADAAAIYKIYQVPLKPKWFPVFYVLSHGERKTVTDISREIGHSHPSVSQIVTEMARAGYLREKKDPADGRRNVVALSAKGAAIREKIAEQYEDVRRAVEALSAQATHDLWEAVQEWEYLLQEKSLLARVQEQRKLRESGPVVITGYKPRYARAFRELNEEWINTYFTMEAPDHQALDHPSRYILRKGGHILVALLNGEPVGVCALLKMPPGPHDFELAKMAVSPKAQGSGVGFRLGEAAIAKVRSLGARSIFLESNTILKPAIALYRKLGFRKVQGYASPYTRCNIQMELRLD